MLLFIGLAVGGFFWYINHAEEVKREAEQAQMTKAVANAKESLSKTREAALKDAKQAEELAAQSLAQCEEATGKIRSMIESKYPPEILAMLRPPEPQELIDARAEAQKPLDAAEKQEPAPAAPAAAAPAAAAPAAPAEGAAPAAAAAPAEGAAPAPAAAAPAAPAEGVAPAAPAAAAPAAEPVEPPKVVKDMGEQWKLLHQELACAFRIRRAVDRLVHDIDAALAIDSVAEYQRVMDLANKYVDRFNEIRSGQDFATLTKNAGKISTGCTRVVKAEASRQRTLAKEEEKVAKKRAGRLNTLKKELATKKAELAKGEEETTAVKEAFAACVEANSGMLKYFDWTRMKRTLNALQIESPYAANQFKKELRKVEALEFSQSVLISNMKDFTFKRAISKDKPGIKGGKVVSVDAKQMVVMVGGKKRTITWVAFYRDYHNNLDEIIGKFIRNGRQNGVKRLNHTQWLNAMIGSAFILRNICADDDSVAGFVEKLVKEAVTAEYRLQLKNQIEVEETKQQPPEITEKDEEIKGVMQEIVDTTAKIDALDIQTRRVPFYQELFPDIDYDELKAKAAEE